MYLHKTLSFIDICISLHESCINENSQCFSFLLVWNTCLMELLITLTRILNLILTLYYAKISCESCERKTKSKVSFKISSLQNMVAMHAVLFQRQLLGDTENLQRRCFKLTRQCCVRPDWKMTNSMFSFPVTACFGHELSGNKYVVNHFACTKIQFKH